MGGRIRLGPWAAPGLAPTFLERSGCRRTSKEDGARSGFFRGATGGTGGALRDGRQWDMDFI